MQLYTKISIALVAGAVAGLAANLLGLDPLKNVLVFIEPIGTAWIRLITMVVVPLVFASLVVGTAITRFVVYLWGARCKCRRFWVAWPPSAGEEVRPAAMGRTRACSYRGTSTHIRSRVGQACTQCGGRCAFC